VKYTLGVYMSTPHLNTKEAVRGVNAYLGANYGITWANEKVASDVCAFVASQLQGPTTLPETGLSPDSAVKIAQLIVNAHESLKAKGYAGEPDSLRKVAAGWSVADLAVATTRFDMADMAKQADALITTGGQHTNRPGESPEALAKLDQHNRPQGEYLVGMGNTDMRAHGSAVIGKEEVHPKAPENTSPTPNSLLEQSKAAFDMQSMMQGAKNMGGRAMQGMQNAGNNAMSGLQGAGKAIGGAAQSAGQAVSNAPADLASLWASLSPEARGALVGGGAGAALGGAGGAMMDDESPLRGGLMGAAGGGLLGAGAGAMYQHGMPSGKAWPGSSAAGHDAANSRNMVGMSDPALDTGYASPYALAQMGKGASDSMALAFKSAQEIGLSNDQTVALLSKMAAGGSLTDSKTNTPEEAAKHDSVAKLDHKNRSPEKYLEGVGKTELPNVGRVEHASKRPDQPGTKEKEPDTTPSREVKSAADEAFMAIFKKTAEEVGPYLPTALSADDKVAHVRRMMGLNESERGEYLKALAK
jgi:hypothetical protein